MVTDNQVIILMKQINQSKTFKTAAAKAAMSETIARKYRRSGKLPRQCKPIHDWKILEDVFGGDKAFLEADRNVLIKNAIRDVTGREEKKFSP